MFAGNLPGITQTMPLAIYVFLYSDPLAGVMLSIILIAIAFAVLITIKLLEQKRFGAKEMIKINSITKSFGKKSFRKPYSRS